MRKSLFKSILVLTIFMSTFSSRAQEKSNLIGRWDITMDIDGKESPSWLEVRLSGYNTLIGRFVYAFGSARPISEVVQIGDQFSFTIPKQWEKINSDMHFIGKVGPNSLEGKVMVGDKTHNWTATRTPTLPHTKNPKWGKSIKLFNGEDLTGWYADRENQWIVESGILTSPTSGANLITEQEFMDFKLHVEFRYPENGNSGIYLRGRYEVQVADSKGMEPSDILFGGVYGFLPPNEIVAKDAGEWQEMDITLLGNRVTVVANGIPVITDQVIPGITGGAIDSKQGTPGPIMIQGDHEPVEFRSIVITPLQK